MLHHFSRFKSLFPPLFCFATLGPRRSPPRQPRYQRIPVPVIGPEEMSHTVGRTDAQQQLAGEEKGVEILHRAWLAVDST